MAGAKLPIFQIKWAKKSPTVRAIFWATKVHTDNVKCTVYYAVIAHWALDAFVVFLLSLCLPCCVLGEYIKGPTYLKFPQFPQVPPAFFAYCTSGLSGTQHFMDRCLSCSLAPVHWLKYHYHFRPRVRQLMQGLV